MEHRIDKILEGANKRRNFERRVSALRENSSKTLKTVLRGAYDDRIRFILPEGMPPQAKLNEDDSKATKTISDHLESFVYFFDEGELVPMDIRIKIFINILETISKREAEILVAMKDKNLHSLFKNLDKETVKTAFPGYIQ